MLLVLGGFCFAISWKVREPWNISLIFAGIILVCGALAWFRRFFRSLRTELLGGDGLAWKSNSELDAAVKGTGIARLAFQLRSSEFEADGDICLVFTPISEVPKEKRYPSHLALRCVVGLTFPSAVAAVRDLSVRIGEKYSVNLGTGVPISIYVVTSRSEETTSLQLTSSEEEGIYRVFVTPYHIRVGKPLGGREFLPKIAAAFETLLNEPLIL